MERFGENAVFGTREGVSFQFDWNFETPHDDTSKEQSECSNVETGQHVQSRTPVSPVRNETYNKTTHNSNRAELVIPAPVLKKSVIEVEEVILALVRDRDEQMNVQVLTKLAPFETGEVPYIEEELSVELSNSAFRKSCITNYIRSNMMEMYPDRYYPDPEVVINNYSFQMRSDSGSFDTFKEDILYTLQFAFNIDCGLD